MDSVVSAVGTVVTDPAGRVLLCQQRQGHRRWGLPGGRVRPGESPIQAAIRDVREETGMETEIVDLVGLYQLTGDTGGEPLPDLVTHVFRGRCDGGEAALNAPGRTARLSWHDPEHLPRPMTATTRTALADAAAGHSGVVRVVRRDTEPELPDADSATLS